MSLQNDDVVKFLVEDDCVAQRIDVFVANRNDTLTRSGIQKLIEQGNVTVNSKTINKNYKLRQNDVVVVDFPKPKELSIVGQDIAIDILYEDDDLLVVNKQKDMVVHPAPGHYDGTLVNALLYHCKDRLSSINGVIRPGIVHRIDKDTSGLLVVAKTDLAHQFLSDQIKIHSFTREYYTVVRGKLKNFTGEINTRIGRDKSDRKKMCVTTLNAKEAVTYYEVLQEFDKYSLLKVKLFTGRTHQIRVHMSYIGHPVAGDVVYGNCKNMPKSEIELQGQCLHAKKLGFIHPSTKEYIEFESELPEYFVNFLKKIEN